MTRTTLAYGGETYGLGLCPPCFQDWDTGIWQWLSVADEGPANDTGLGCYYCGAAKVDDRIRIGYSKREWFFPLCEADTQSWTSFLWGWIRLSESIAKPFQWRAQLRLSKPAVPAPAATPAPEVVPVEKQASDDDYRLANHVALQMRDLGLTWPEVAAVLTRPLAVAETDSEGIRRYMSPSLTVFANETFHLVVGVRRELGYKQQGFSPEARAYIFTAHALERMEERHIRTEDVLRALDDRRKIVVPDRIKSNVNVILSQDLKLAVDPTSREVLTVCWRGCEKKAVAS